MFSAEQPPPNTFFLDGSTLMNYTMIPIVFQASLLTLQMAVAPLDLGGGFSDGEGGGDHALMKED